MFTGPIVMAVIAALGLMIVIIAGLFEVARQLSELKKVEQASIQTARNAVTALYEIRNVGMKTLHAMRKAETGEDKP